MPGSPCCWPIKRSCGAPRRRLRRPTPATSRRCWTACARPRRGRPQSCGACSSPLPPTGHDQRRASPCSPLRGRFFEGCTGTVRACTVRRVLSGAGWSIRPTRTPPDVLPGLQVRSDAGPAQVSACQHPEQFVPMTLPSFLCIGATKAGTTWLHDQLDQHPGVCMPLVKELHYFSARHSPGHRQWAEQTVDKAFRRELRHARRRADTGETDREDARHLRRIRSHEIFSDDWYRACVDRPGHGGGVVGEITPAYAELPVEGIAEMQRMLRGVRIIHILRHPYDRALAHLRISLHRRGMPVDEEGMLKMLDRQPQIFSRGAYR